MKKILCIFLMLLIQCSSFAEDFTLQAGVSINDIPKAFFGSWRVNAKLEDTNSYATFKPQSTDLWNLSRDGETVTL